MKMISLARSCSPFAIRKEAKLNFARQMAATKSGSATNSGICRKPKRPASLIFKVFLKRISFPDKLAASGRGIELGTVAVDSDRRSELGAVHHHAAVADVAVADNLALFPHGDRPADRANDGVIMAILIRSGLGRNRVRRHRKWLGTNFFHSGHELLKTNRHASVEVISKERLPGGMTTPTVIENGELYFAHHKASRTRAALFRRLQKTPKQKTTRICN
jgi:hypothetical protein